MPSKQRKLPGKTDPVSKSSRIYDYPHKLTPQQQIGMDNWVEMDGFSYGNLMRVMTEPWKAGFATVPGEYGWDGWLGCYFANIPDTEMTILMMMQKKDAGTFELTRRLRNVILLAR